MSYTTLQIEHTGKVATIWLNRPELHNALNEALIAELTEAVCQLNRDASSRDPRRRRSSCRGRPAR